MIVVRVVVCVTGRLGWMWLTDLTHTHIITAHNHPRQFEQQKEDEEKRKTQE